MAGIYSKLKWKTPDNHGLEPVMKKLISTLTAAFLGITFLTWAYAANIQCPTRPPGDNTNACASTAFVTQAITSNITGPGSAIVGQIATWANAAATQLAAKFGYTKSIIYAADYGVVGDGSTNNNTTLQAAYTAAATFPATGKGAVVFLPCGQVNLSAGIVFTYGVKTKGCGAGNNRVLPLNTADIGGTVINQTCTTCDTFLVTTLDSVQFEDIGFNAPLNATAGSIIHIKAPAAVDGREQNLQSIITNVSFIGGYNQITCELCANYSIFNNEFRSPANHGLNLTNSAAFSDSGDAQIYANTFWVLLTTAPDNFFPFGGDCIHIETQSGINIFSNKMLACNVGINVVANQGVAGVLLISHNNIEVIKTFAIRVAQGTAGISYGQIHIISNNVQIGGAPYSATVAGAIAILPGAAQYVSTVDIVNNNINVGQGVVGTRCMFISDGNGVKVVNNTCNLGNIANQGGISVKDNATNVSLFDNRMVAIAAGQPRYDLTVPALCRDLYGMAFADYPANCSAGSTLYITDGKSTNIGAGNFTVTGGGNGCVSWKNSTSVYCLAP
jgi:hypothetical protein